MKSLSDQMLDDLRRMSEGARITREEFEEARQLVKLFQGLLDSEAWKKLIEIVAGQKHLRLDSLSQPMFTVEDVLKHQLNNGEMMGMDMFVALPQTLIETAQFTIEQYKAQPEEDEDVED